MESEKKNKIHIVSFDNVSLDEIANLTPYSKEDLKAYSFLDGENLLLSTLFYPISALPQKKYSSLSLLSSNMLFYQSLELEKNKIFNNRFYGEREVA